MSPKPDNHSSGAGGTQQTSDFRYVYSCDLHADVEVRVVSIEGVRSSFPTGSSSSSSSSWSSHLAPLWVEASVHCNGRLVGHPVAASYRPLAEQLASGSGGGGSGLGSISKSSGLTGGGHSYTQKVEEWLKLPVRYSELSRDALLHITLWTTPEREDEKDPNREKEGLDGRRFVGQTWLRLFSRRGVFKQSVLDLRVAEGGRPRPLDAPPRFSKFAASSDVAYLSKVRKQQADGLIDRAPWLDRLAFSEVDKLIQKAKQDDSALAALSGIPAGSSSASALGMWVVLQMPAVRLGAQSFAIVYFEATAAAQTAGNTEMSSSIWAAASLAVDPELGLSNLCEAKYLDMTRWKSTTVSEKELKPNAVTRDKLDAILQMAPGAPLSVEQSNLVWRFRHHLSSNPRALPKFVAAMNWQRAEARDALALVYAWAPIDVRDALELLGTACWSSATTGGQGGSSGSQGASTAAPETKAAASEQLSLRAIKTSIRRFAVDRLWHAASREDMLLYLPQLVQALKYEPDEEDETALSGGSKQDDDITVVGLTGDAEPIELGVDAGAAIDPATPTTGGDKLASSLIKYALSYPTAAYALFWYTRVEAEVSLAAGAPRWADLYKRLNAQLMTELRRAGSESSAQAAAIDRQVEFVQALRDVYAEVQRAQPRERSQALRTTLARSTYFKDLHGLPLPLDPSVRLLSVVADSCQAYTSAQTPLKLVFNVEHADPARIVQQLEKDKQHHHHHHRSDRTTASSGGGGSSSLTSGRASQQYALIYKQGDDLRQDALILQMVRLADRLLMSENLQLRLTPYTVLATGRQEGLVQFIRSQSFRNIINKHESLLGFMHYCRPLASGPFGIEPLSIDNFVRSCAGYSILSYVFGVGDRHTDNLLLCEDGRLFHIDFGFILGRDPKPMPAPFKLTAYMIDAMGGMNSQYWRDFCGYCFEAFRILRRHANLLLNLWALMTDAAIPDIAVERDKAVQKIESHLRLELDDEAAHGHMLQLISTSANARMPVIVDALHNIKQNYLS